MAAMTIDIKQMQDDLDRDKLVSAYEARLLELLLNLRKAYPTNAALAPEFIAAHGGWRPAAAWLIEARKDLDRMMRGMLLCTVLEGKEQISKKDMK